MEGEFFSKEEHDARLPPKGVVIRLELVQWLALEHLPTAYEVFSCWIQPEEDSYQPLIFTRSPQEANAFFDKELAKSRRWKEVKGAYCPM